MKVAVEWMRSFGDFSELTDEQLADKLTMAGLEVEETLGTGESAVFVTKVTPNRGDWLSVYGVAREASAATSLPLNKQISLSGLPLADDIGGFTVDVRNNVRCPRFGAAVITGVNYNPSPQFIQNRLILAGMRPLNAVVDITNYVMLELGQPLHAYDQSTLAGNKIVVRDAVDGEVITTLDGVEHKLSADILVIADVEKPIAIAGIMGGGATEVTPSTHDIVLEAAHFDASAVRRGAKLLGITTEASYRFERFVDPELVPVALARAIELIVKYAGGTPLESSIDRQASKVLPKKIELRTSRVNKILGLSLSQENVAKSLARLGLAVELQGENIEVQVPTFRPDLTGEIDLIEEVGRMVGYWNLPETVPDRPGTLARDFDKGEFDTTLRNIMAGQGLVETYSHTLGSDSPFDDPSFASQRVVVRSSLSSELSGLRVTLLPHLLDALALNLRHGAGIVRLFETGKVFLRNGDSGYEEPRHISAVFSGGGADYSSAKGLVENLLDSLNIKNVSFVASGRFGMHPRRCSDVVADGIKAGYVSEIDPYLASEQLELPPSTGRIAAFELDVEILRTLHERVAVGSYEALPKFPSVTRDIALLYGLDVAYGEIKEIVAEAAGILLEEISLLSVYTGDRVAAGYKSIAVRLTLRSRTRTLTESDAEAIVTAVKQALTEKFAAKDR
jgi:phenylalanyl-tRNA synthetase beta chain